MGVLRAFLSDTSIAADRREMRTARDRSRGGILFALAIRGLSYAELRLVTQGRTSTVAKRVTLARDLTAVLRERMYELRWRFQYRR